MEPKRGAAPTVAMVALTVTTGMVEAVSFLALGQVFTAMMTGNLIFLGFGIAGEGGLSVAATSVSFGAFVVGAIAGVSLESAVEARGHRWFVTALAVESALIALAALVVWETDRTGGAPTGRFYGAIAPVALAMGMRNVTSMRARVPDLPTTVETRTLTALLGGLAFAHDTRLVSGATTEVRRAASVAAMFAGGLIGAWMLHQGLRPSVVLLVVAGSILAVAIAYGTAPGSRPPAG